MEKHLVLARDAEGDWYERGKKFFAENGASPLQMLVDDEASEKNEFRKALVSLSTSTGAQVEIDPKAGLITLSVNDPISIKSARLPHCQCQCGATSSCGGGGGGAPIVMEDE